MTHLTCLKGFGDLANGEALISLSGAGTSHVIGGRDTRGLRRI